MPKLHSNIAKRHSLNIPVPNLVIIGPRFSPSFLLGLLQRAPTERRHLNLLPKVWSRALVWQPSSRADWQMGFTARFEDPH